VPTLSWDNWLATAYQTTGHPLVFKGDTFYNQARDLYFTPDSSSSKTLMEEFIEVYKNRPDPVNLCGIRINHAMALFLAVRHLNPSLVVESGVNAGISTYFIRAASNTTKIFAIDPSEVPICKQEDRWIDTVGKENGLTKYYTGKDFVDLMDIDWKSMIENKEVDPDTSLVFLDDHLHAFQRIASVMKLGFRHVVVEDNYKLGEGATFQDKTSTPKQYFRGGQYQKEGEWLFTNIIKYAEFPPIVPPIVAKEFTEGGRKKAGGFMWSTDKNEDIVAPILRPDLSEKDRKTYEDIARKLEIDPSLKDNLSYMQFMNYNQICYLELLPFPDSVRNIFN
jgi:hypothetical protein